ncbi:MAG: glyoxylate/hydroxypyruvate reductase A [Enterobacterales bacterium]|nr:glyoxylate/hydroxypyruvate reductase A [Enterobacterales bacterium]
MHPVIPFISQLPSSQQQIWLESLQKAMADEQILLAKDVKWVARNDAEIAILADPDPEQLQLFKNLKWIHTLGAGVEHLIHAAQQKSIKLVRLQDPNLSQAMAESVLTWTLYISKKVPSYRQQQRQKIWRQLPVQPNQQCNIGILGFGEMGKASALILLDNGFQVCAWNRSKKKLTGIKVFSGQDELPAFLENCQILVCLLPLTVDTRHIINHKLLQKLPKGGSVINFSRGGTLNKQDLIQQLDNGHLYHAVLDVFDQEPLAAADSLWRHEKITLLPHIAALSDPITASTIVSENIQFYRENGQLRQFVDLERGY